MSAVSLYPRHAKTRLLEALADTPVVLIHGPRQCGKTTLARMAGESRGYAYYDFDDKVVLAAAREDPVGFVAGLSGRTILDEVQRVPELFRVIKREVDRRRTPGRFLLTGSSHLLTVPRIAESLAGRMEILRLHPLSQTELTRRRPHFLEQIFEGGFKTAKTTRLGAALVERIVAGGYPAALKRATPRRRATWYRNYVETLVERDARDLARIRSLDVLPRLLALAAGQTAQLLNVSDLAGPFHLSRPTIRKYVTLLERLFLIDALPPWHSNRLSRLVKSPKLHMGDTGLTCALLGFDGPGLAKDRGLLGQLLETFVFQELRRQASGYEEEIRFHHFRDKDGLEVDLVLERAGREIASLEVKAAASVRRGDFRGLRKLRDSGGDRFVSGVLLYDGETSVRFGERLWAIPIKALWEKR